MNFSRRTKIAIQINDVLNLFYVILFLLFCRNIIVIYHLYFYSEMIDQIYTFGAIIVAVIFVVYVFFIRRLMLDSRILGLLSLDASLVLISTILNNGSISNFVATYYPMFVFFCFADFITQDEKKFKKFINTMSILFIVLLSVNFLLAGFSGDYFKEQFYFLGLENQMVFCYLLGFYFNWLNKEYNKANYKLTLYMLVWFLNAYAIRSATSQIVLVLAFLVSVFPFAKRIIENLKTRYIVIGIFSVLIILVVYSLQFERNIFLNDLIVRVFQKTATLSGRTEIWRQLFNRILEKPFLGYGVQDTFNVFLLQGSYGSPHNAFFLKLYYGGFSTFLIYVFIIFMLVKHTDLIEAKQISFIQKLVFILMTLPLMTEAVTITYLYIVLFFGIGISKNKSLSKIQTL